MTVNTIADNKKFIEVEPGVKLHITDQGEGLPVVLIPGLPMSDEMFKHTYRFLTGNGFRAIGITLRGFGESDSATTYNIDVHAADIQVILNTLQLDEVILAGYSLGGVIAAYYAARYRSPLIKKLLLISANVPKYTRTDDFPYGPLPEDVNNLIAFSETNLEVMLNVYGPVFQLTEEQMPLETGNWINSINLQTTQKAMTEGIKLLRDTDLRPLLNQIDVPVTIFHAKDDAMVPFSIAEQALAGLKDSRLIIFPKGGHWFVLVDRDYFHQQLLGFLNDGTDVPPGFIPEKSAEVDPGPVR